MPVLAHHSAASQYDLNKKMTITGTLVKVEWQNPHNWYHIDVKDDGGAITHWAVEGAPPGHLFRDGVQRSTILGLVGNTVTMEGSPARDGSRNMSAHKMTLSDGKDLPM
jgi:RPA family protein